MGNHCCGNPGENAENKIEVQNTGGIRQSMRSSVVEQGDPQFGFDGKG